MNNVAPFLLLLAGLLIISNLKAQSSAPTLSFGLDRVLFGNSPLDADLLASIIADRQDDLKKRIVEKEILSPMFSNSAFVTQDYVHGLITNLMNEKDKNILKKEVMELTSNYALVYTLSEMYLQLSWDEIQKGTYLDSIGAFPMKKGEEFSLNSSAIAPFDTYEFTKQKLALSDSLYFTIQVSTPDTKTHINKRVPFNALLLDMIFQAVRSHPTFLEKGFSNRPMYFSIDQYRETSFYHHLSSTTLKEKMYADVKNFIDAVGSSHAIFEDLIDYLDQNQEVDTIDNTIAQETVDTVQEIDGHLDSHITKSQVKSLPLTVDSVKNELKNLRLKNLSKDDDAKAMLEDYYFLLYSIKPNILPVQAKEAQRKINEHFLPKLSVYNLQQEGKLDGLIESTVQLSEALKTSFQEPILEALSNKHHCRQMQNLLNEKKEIIHLYLEFFSRLDELDKTETYYYLLKNLTNCGDQMSNQSGAKAMNLLLQSIDKYTSFELEEDRISVDVESIILALFDYYGSREKKPFHLHMTVGANNSFLLKQDASETGRTEENNFTFLSEKLGFRVNLINWQMRSSYGLGEIKPQSKWLGLPKNTTTALGSYPMEPAVSNLHVLVYGSGFVSQLVHLTNSKFQARSFVGTGIGVTFFNNLSVNTSLLFPIQSSNRLDMKQTSLNVGFDVYFTQYIAAMNKKRNETKLAKIEMEKYKIDMDYRTKQLEMEMREKNSLM
jgi:hypothetical protein